MANSNNETVSGFRRYDKRSTSPLASRLGKSVERRHTEGEFRVNMPQETMMSCSVASDDALRVHQASTSYALQDQQLLKHAEPTNVTEITTVLDSCTQHVLESSPAARVLDHQLSPGSEVDKLPCCMPAETPGSERTHIVVEVHPESVGRDNLSTTEDNIIIAGKTTSPPELHRTSLTSLDTRTYVANSCERIKELRQFTAIIAVADDMSRHSTCRVRRSRSYTHEVATASQTKRLVISLTNLDTTATYNDIILVQHRQSSLPASSQPAPSTLASSCSSDQIPLSTTPLKAVAPSTCSPRRPSTCESDWREVSKELWSLRALLANREDISVDDSVEEATVATSATTPQSADDGSVKSSADTVVNVDAGHGQSPTSATAAVSVASPTTTAATDTAADSQSSSTIVSQPTSSNDDGITRKPSIRRQNYREAIARRQNHRLQALDAASHELSVPTSSVEASSEPTDTESSQSFEFWTHAGSAASSIDTTASSFRDSVTSTDSVGGGSVSDSCTGGHRLEQLRGDSGYRSLEAQQSLGQARDFRRQSASHFFFDSSANVIYEDQMTVATSSSNAIAPVSPSSSVVSVQQMQSSAAVSSAEPNVAGSVSVRAGHRQNKAAKHKRIQYKYERQAVQIQDSVVAGDQLECKVPHHSQHHQHHHQQQQQSRPSTDADSTADNLEERSSTVTTATATATKPSLFSRLLRTTHVGAASTVGVGSVAGHRSSLNRMQRDYSIDERSNAIFNEFLRHDPAYDAKHTLSVHGRSSRTARRNRTARSPMSARPSRRRLAIEERFPLKSTAAESMPLPSMSPLLARKHLLVEALADQRISGTLVPLETPHGRRRRSEGSSRLLADVSSAVTVHATVDDRQRRLEPTTRSSSAHDVSADRSQLDCQSSSTSERLSSPVAGETYGDDADSQDTSQNVSQRHCVASSRSIPVIQLTTDDDTLQ